jgi:hypothetical protein
MVGSVVRNPSKSTEASHESMTIGIEQFRDHSVLRQGRMLLQALCGAAGLDRFTGKKAA